MGRQVVLQWWCGKQPTLLNYKMSVMLSTVLGQNIAPSGRHCLWGAHQKLGSGSAASSSENGKWFSLRGVGSIWLLKHHGGQDYGLWICHRQNNQWAFWYHRETSARKDSKSSRSRCKVNCVSSVVFTLLLLLSHSVVAGSVCLDGSPQAPLSMGILQARLLEWIAMPASRGSAQPRDWTQVSCIAGRFFTTEPPGKPM